jgi:multidrug efflux pump subunit AcrA (membrane-fusion protein)
MPDVVVPLPCRRSELVIRPLGDQGPYVVKDPGTGSYYHLGAEEHFLLTQLDGQRDPDAIRVAFAERFGQPLSEEELQEFLQAAQGQGLLQPIEEPGRYGGARPERSDGRGLDLPRPLQTQGVPPTHHSPLTTHSGRQNILYWRKNFLDPDRFFNWLAPKIWWFWSPAFLAFSAGCISLATVLVWADRQELAQSFLSSLRWETAILAWLVLLFVTTCHEFAHGLTCKHYGGEVHEVGFLMIFFMPCFYCNVSDAWLFKEKSKRLWVTLAGGYFELFSWSLMVFIWRVTVTDSLINYLAFMVMTACGVQTLFNFNPLLKLDGYYLISDWLEVPNLQERASQHVMSRLRWLLWGAARPELDERDRTLLIYGLVSWLYSLVFLALSLIFMTHFFGTKFGVLGLILVGFLGLMSVRGVFHGFTAGEVRNMILFRCKRAVIWTVLLAGVPAALFLIPIQDRASGPFALRAAVRVELRAPVAGFLREIRCEEGDRVSAGMLVVRLDVPDLPSRIAQKQAEVREAQSKLRLLETGPRFEEIEQQRYRVERAAKWRDDAQHDQVQAKQAFTEDLKRLDRLAKQHQAERDAAQDLVERSKRLRGKGTISEDDYVDAQKKLKVAQAQIEQVQAQKAERQAMGTQQADTELSRREKELADARATLTLLQAGTRPEEIDAERSHLARLQEEVRYLEGIRDRLPIHSPVAGLIVTPRLKERFMHYVREGEVIAVVEEPAELEAEISMAEQNVARVHAGQSVELKARAFPFDVFKGQVDRVAPAAGRGDVQSTLTVYCRLESSDPSLRSGMTGHARVFTGSRSVGGYLLDRALRFVRTEFWW